MALETQGITVDCKVCSVKYKFLTFDPSQTKHFTFPFNLYSLFIYLDITYIYHQNNNIIFDMLVLNVMAGID